MNTFRFKSILATLALLIVFSGTAFGEEVIVGTGTSTSDVLPFCSDGNYYSTTECIYTATELNGAGVITQIAYNVSSANNTNPMPIKVYMRHRNNDTYSSSSDCAPAAELTLVFSGDIYITRGWNTITLDTPFAYNGSDNLEVVVCKNRNTSSSTSDNYFYYTSTSDKTLYRRSSSSNYGDVTYTSDFRKSSSRPNTKFIKSGGSYTKDNIKYVYYNNLAYVTETNFLSGAVTIPSTIQPGDGNTYNVVDIEYSAFRDCTGITSVSIPSTVTALGSYVFEGCTNLSSITFTAAEPAALTNSTSLPYDIPIYVPSAAIATYKAAESWKEHKDQIMAVGTKTDYDLTGTKAVTAESGMSVLHSKIGEDHLAEVISLKVEGTINSYDLMIMRNKMTALRHLDLSKATIVANSYEYYQGYCSEDNTLSKWCLNDSLHTVKLPESLIKIGKSAFKNLCHISEIVIQAKVTEIGDSAFYGLTKITSISIPKSVTSIGSYAFNGCSALNSLTFEDGENSIYLGYGYYYNIYEKINNNNYYQRSPFAGCPIVNLYIGRKLSYSSSTNRLCTCNQKLQSVEFGEYASTIDAGQFAGCTSLKEVKGLENIKSIGQGAFYNCTSLTSLTIPSNVTAIEPWAFRGTGLTSMNIPSGITSLGDYAYADCSSLASFTFADDSQVTAIPNYFLQNATSLKDIALPKNTLTIGNYAFYGCTQMQECKISSKITKIGDYAFNNCTNLNSVYAYTYEPQAIDQNTFSTYQTATLHIPSTSYLLYFYDTQWSQFLKLVGFDSEAEQVGINVDYNLYTETNGIIGGKPRIDISIKGGLTIEGSKVQPCGEIHIAANDNYFGSVIANGNLTADKLYFDITVSKDKWYFFCFPFDIPLANITKGGSYKWAEYDGNVRANNGTTGWKDLASGTTMLTKGKGYIFRTNYAGELSLRVDDPTFNAVNEQTTLTSYVSETSANADWNMVGNPFPCYYPINKMEYGAPIIVWNGSSYDAYRPGDDDYTFHPFEAFFV